MNSAASDLETPRGRVFFWIGLVILPVFWIWWMTPGYFTRKQRYMGWIWSAVFVLVLALFREPVGRFLPELALGYPAIAIRLNLTLLAWLLARWLGLKNLVMVSIVSIDCLAMIASLFVPTWRVIVHKMPWIESSMLVPAMMFAPALLLAVMHLMLDPVQSWWHNFKARKLREQSS